MYYVSKRMEIAGAHKLQLPYESKCSAYHGHNWIVTVYCKAEETNKSGMIIDFTHIKRHIHDRLDHQVINEVLYEINPTAENIAKWICKEVSKHCETGKCYKVSVQESEGNVAIYEEDE